MVTIFLVYNAQWQEGGDQDMFLLKSIVSTIFESQNEAATTLLNPIRPGGGAYGPPRDKMLNI